MPLALVNRNTGSSSQAQAPAIGLSAADATKGLNEVQRKLTKSETDFSKLVRKPRKTKAEMRKFGMLSREIDRLQARKNDFTAIIDSLAPANQLIVKPESNPVSLVPSRVNSHLPVQIPAPFQYPALPALEEQKKPIIQPQPVASGSNVRLPDVHPDYKGVKMDFEDENDGMSSDDTELPQNVLAALRAAAADPTGYGENFDADGNFHGRGRDRFKGPQAKADEYAAFCSCA